MVKSWVCWKCKKYKWKWWCRCWRPLEYKEEYVDAMNNFFQLEKWEEHIDIVRWKDSEKQVAKRFPTIQRFSVEIWVHRETLLEWANKKDDKGNLVYPKFSEAYKRAAQIQEAIRLENTLKWLYNPQFAIFLWKNVFGYKDKQEIEQTNTNIEIEISEEQKKVIARRILDGKTDE